MKKLLKVGARFLLVTIGVVFLTSFSIDATDTFRGSQTALGIFSQNIFEQDCAAGMVEIITGSQRVCVDQYEASPSVSCIVAEPKSSSDTAANVADSDCIPVSEPNMVPWIHVAEPQAVQLCAKANKRLLTAEEWFSAAKGTPDSSSNCNLDGVLARTGSFPLCTSGAGALDMVGNVWEILGDKVDPETVWRGGVLPMEGYVAGVDVNGLPIATEEVPNIIFNNDYFWSGNLEYSTIMRGGFYGSKEDGGVYATHAKTAPTFASAAIGFRCAKTL